MNDSERLRIIKILKVLLAVDDQEITRCTIESLIEELEDVIRKDKQT